MGCVFRPKDRNTWWVKYRRAGKTYYESSDSKRKTDAIDLLRRREGAIAAGVPVTPKAHRLTFTEAATDAINDYTTNGKRSLVVVRRRIEKHLTPYFGGAKMANITTADVRAYVAHRQTEGVVSAKGKRKGERLRDVSNAEINRELATLKRMFVLATQAGTLLHRPHIPMLRESAPRAGFFESDQLAAVLRHLPDDLQPVIRFAAITGWRIASEVLPLEWRQVDFAAGEIRLDAGTTKNGDGRVFPFAPGDPLHTVLIAQHAAHEALAKAGHLCPHVFYRLVAKGRGGPKEPKAITTFTGSWRSACRAAGCPGRVPHDLRRTAVRNLVRSGVSENTAMRLTGHKTRSVFDRYDIVSGDDLRQAARRLHGRPIEAPSAATRA
jgi:integrase